MPTTRPIPGRSQLFTPATKPERFTKAASVGADALIIDLEDSVAPCDKDAARSNALGYILKHAEVATLVALRINAASSTRAGLDDLAALLDSEADPDFLVLPKIEAASDLLLVDRLLTAAGKHAVLLALIESARALVALDEIVAATQRLSGLMFGAADMAADLGADVAWEPLAPVRMRIVAAAAVRGLPVVDTPFFEVGDKVGLRHETEAARAFGFAGKAAIHPSQIATISAVFTPDATAVDHARAVLAANSKGVGTVDGAMIDEAVARKARRTLALAGEAQP